MLDEASRQPKQRPVGWQLSQYGPAEGHAELKGYYEGRRAALPTPKKPKRRRRRHARRHQPRRHA